MSVHPGWHRRRLARARRGPREHVALGRSCARGTAIGGINQDVDLHPGRGGALPPALDGQLGGVTAPGPPTAAHAAVVTARRNPQGMPCGRPSRVPHTSGWPRIDAAVMGSCRVAMACIGLPRWPCVDSRLRSTGSAGWGPGVRSRSGAFGGGSAFQVPARHQAAVVDPGSVVLGLESGSNGPHNAAPRRRPSPRPARDHTRQGPNERGAAEDETAVSPSGARVCGDP